MGFIKRKDKPTVPPLVKVGGKPVVVPVIVTGQLMEHETGEPTRKVAYGTITATLVGLPVAFAIGRGWIPIGMGEDVKALLASIVAIVTFAIAARQTRDRLVVKAADVVSVTDRPL